LQADYIPTYDDYISLGVNPFNTTSIDPSVMDLAPLGNDALGEGKLIGIVGDPKIYIVNNHKLVHIPDPGVFNVFGFNWGAINTYSTDILTDYPVDTGTLKVVKLNDGSYSYIINGYRLSLSPSAATAYGLKTDQFKQIGSQVSAHMAPGIPLSKFMQNVNDGKIYYASGGALHYVSTYDSFVAYGGPRTPVHLIDSAFLSYFNVAQPI
jgi:hypothetical protein